MPQAVRNIAILAHVDAGKTTLSERILFAAGEVRRPGKVEEGLATMDYMPEEKERGITIESGVAHFEWKDTWFNFIDTPGHVDFGAEVDMALSAVEGGECGKRCGNADRGRVQEVARSGRADAPVREQAGQSRLFA